MQRFTLAELSRQRAEAGRAYHEFLRVPSMSAGVYHLAAGATDSQSPHSEDELYYIVEGSATLLVDTEEVPVEAGSMVFVPAHVVHRFHDISADLTIMVFFAPPEYSQQSPTDS